MKSDVCYYNKHLCSCRVVALTKWLKEPHIWTCLCVCRALIWRGRSVLWPMPSALPGIRKTPCGMFSTSPPWRLCPAFRIGLRSNAPRHGEALSGFLSSLPGLRFTSTHPLSERTAPKAACSCRTRDPVCAQMCHTAYGLISLLNSCLIVFALKKKDNTIITRTKIILQSISFFFFRTEYLCSEISSFNLPGAHVLIRRHQWQTGREITYKYGDYWRKLELEKLSSRKQCACLNID